jgi:LysR family nitrogen assimilation transcriptional regulator
VDRRQFEYFVRIAELRSFRRASQELRIAQPALTRQIKNLEQELGVPLFERQGRGIVLTAAGSLMLERARYILRQIDQMRADITAEATVPSGRVAFGAPPSIAELLFARLARSYARHYPHVQLRFLEGIGHMWEWLLHGEIDLAVIPSSGNAVETPCVLEQLVEEPVYLVGAAGDPTMTARVCCMHDVLLRPLVIAGHPNTPRRRLERFAAQNRAALRVLAESENLRVLTALVTAGLGYGILPHSAIHYDVEAGRLAISRIEGLTVSRILARRADRPLTPAVREMVRLTRLEVESLVQEGAFGPRAAAAPPRSRVAP